MRTTIILIFITLKTLSQTNDSLNELYYFPKDYKLYVEQDIFSTKFKTYNYKELLNSLNSKRPYEKCLAFHYLLKFKETKIFDILLQNLSDTTKMRIQEGSIIRMTSVSDYFMQFANEIAYPENIVKLTKEQKKTIDSFILNSDLIGSNSLFEVLKCIKPLEKNYKRIKYLANSENHEAMVALSKYRKKENLSLIDSLLKSKSDKDVITGLECVAHCPESIFFPIILDIFEKEWQKKMYSYPKWYYLYASIAKYENSKTKELFLKTVKCKDEFRQQTLSVYLKKAIFSKKYFKEIFEQIKLDDIHEKEFVNYIENDKC